MPHNHSSIPDPQSPVPNKDLLREILLSFFKVHILHHAAKGPVVGHWMLQELRRHGYDVSPGTLYPILARMQQRGWLETRGTLPAHPKAARQYFLTTRGHEVLAAVREHVRELHREVIEEKDPSDAD